MTLDARAAVRDHLRAEIDAPEFFRALEQRLGQHRRAAAHVQDPPEFRRQHLEREALLRGEGEFTLLPASLYSAVLRQALIFSMLSHWITAMRPFGGAPSITVMFEPAARILPPFLRIVACAFGTYSLA